MVSVFSYLDYRRYLRDRFAELKRSGNGYSFRSFSRKAGLRSPAFLKLVMDRKRNLAAQGVEGISRGFALKPKERQYFELLVGLDQARKPEEKNRYFRKILGNRRFVAAKPLAEPQFSLFSNWYYVAILEAVRMEAFGPRDVRWLQKILHPPISIKKIKRAVADLKKLGFLEEGPDGGLKRLEPMLSSEDEARSISLANFHVQMSKMAARAVMNEPAEDREFSALTIALSPEALRRAKIEIQKFRRKLHSILEQAGKEAKTCVAHLNVQLFKLTRAEKLP